MPIERVQGLYMVSIDRTREPKTIYVKAENPSEARIICEISPNESGLIDQYGRRRDIISIEKAWKSDFPFWQYENDAK